MLLTGLAVAAGSVGAAHAGVPIYSFFVKHTYHHDPQAFTQGLFYKDGFLYESTGLHGHSSVRKVQLETGKVLMKKDIDAQYFGEGIAAVGNDIVALTWKSERGFVFDAKDFSVKQQFAYPGEGWGLTGHGEQLFMSDGSASIRVLDARTRAELRRIPVVAEGKPLDRLNELEWVEGQLFANVWGSDVIARIDPLSGQVVGWIDLRGLLDAHWGTPGADDVLNGIAYDAKHKRLFVTGKHWPALFEIELVERRGR